MDSSASFNGLAIIYFILAGVYFLAGIFFLGFWQSLVKLKKEDAKKYLYFSLTNFVLAGFSFASACIEVNSVMEKIYFWTIIKWIVLISFPPTLLIFAVEAIGVKKNFYRYITKIFIPISLTFYLAFLIPEAMVKKEFVIHEFNYFGYHYSHLRAKLGLGGLLCSLWAVGNAISLVIYWLICYFKDRRQAILVFYFMIFVLIGSYEALALLIQKGFNYHYYIGTSLFSLNGAILILLMSSQMISEVMKIGRSAQQKSRELSMTNEEISFLMGTISHDVNSPLLSIRGFADILEDRTLSKQKLTHYLNRIHTNANHINQLLKDLANFAKIGYVEEKIENTHFRKTIKEAIDILDLKNKYPHIKVKIIGNPKPILASPKRLKEITINLIQNALKYTSEENGEVKITLTEEKEGILFSCEDNGIGIPPELQEKVFEKFFRHGPDSRGTGMGLTIVKKIVESFHGRVWIDPHFQKGTRVCVYWPNLSPSLNPKTKQEDLKHLKVA